MHCYVKVIVTHVNTFIILFIYLFSLRLVSSLLFSCTVSTNTNKAFYCQKKKKKKKMKRLVYGCGCCIIEQDICEAKEIGDVSKRASTIRLY